VNLDVPQIDVLFVNEPDLQFNELGARGLGEIGLPGCAAAIANAVYSATGKRFRDLPITPKAADQIKAHSCQRELGDEVMIHQILCGN
jgi:CO/xanthine dehydrogenase Mo-binding subunit